MPDLGIPLRAIQFQTQTPGEALSLQQLSQNMQLQRAQFAETVKLNQLRAQVMATKEARAEMDFKLQQDKDRRSFSTRMNENYWKVYTTATGSEQDRIAAANKAWLEDIDKAESSGSARAMGISQEEVAKARSSFPKTPWEARIKSESLKDAMTDVDTKAAADIAKGGTVPIKDVGKGPTDAVTGQPVPESVDPKSGAVVRGIDQTPPTGKEIPADQTDPIDITARAEKDTPDSLRVQAKDEEAIASRLETLGSKAANAQAKEHRAKADKLRSASVALEQRIQKDTDQELKAAREKRIKDAQDGAVLRPEDAAFIAKEVWAGNQTAASGLARNQQAKTAVIRAITDEGKRRNATPEDLAAKVAEFRGIEAGQRTLGTRTANLGVAIEELKQFLPVAQAASDKVPRTGFVPINKLTRMGREQWSPEQAAFEAANRSIINAFAQVASRSGGTTVHNTEEAEHMLNTAQTPEQYKAVLKQLMLEAQAAGKAPAAVRKEFSDSVSGKSEGGTYYKEKKKEPIKWDELN